jgi:hypothetical protein
MRFFTLSIWLCLIFYGAAQGQGALNVLVAPQDLRCPAGKDGKIRLDLLAGKVPVKFEWDNLNTDDVGAGELDMPNDILILDGLSAGLHRFIFTDANNLSKLVEVTLTEPAALQVQLVSEGDRCFGYNEGLIDAQNTQGGTPPYTYSLENQPFSAFPTWDDLTPGIYFVYVKDSRGCQTSASAVLPTGTQFELGFIPDTSIISGDTLVLTFDPPVDSLIWSPAATITTLPGRVNLFYPFFSTDYTVTAVDTNGCLATSGFRLTVTRNRSVYAPNVFMPTSENVDNQHFTLYGSEGISELKYLTIFDRDGRVVFDREKFAIGIPNLGWDGTSRGKAQPAGVYTWGATARFLDGREELYWGEVTLLR